MRAGSAASLILQMNISTSIKMTVLQINLILFDNVDLIGMILIANYTL